MADKTQQDAGEPREQRPTAGTEMGRTYGGAAKSLARDRDFIADLRDGVAAQTEAAAAWIKERPAAGAAFGLALGVLIGIMIGRGTRG